jgi:hypothetical protein
MCVRRKHIIVTSVLLVFVLATAGKHVFNQIEFSFYNLYNSPESRSSASAKEQGVWLADFKVEPTKLAREDKTYEFQEAWLEAAYEPSNFLVWFSWSKRAKWNYLCVRPKTHWFQESFSFELTPQFEKKFMVTGLGKNGVGFTLSGNDLYFQKVPTDLRKLGINVSVYIYGNGKDISLGTARLHLANIE